MATLTAMPAELHVKQVCDEWDYDEVCDSSCGWPCTPDGCHDSHPSGMWTISGPDWVEDGVYHGAVTSEQQARLIASSPTLLKTLHSVAASLTESGCDPELLAKVTAAITLAMPRKSSKE